MTPRKLNAVTFALILSLALTGCAGTFEQGAYKAAQTVRATTAVAGMPEGYAEAAIILSRLDYDEDERAVLRMARADIEDALGYLESLRSGQTFTDDPAIVYAMAVAAYRDAEQIISPKLIALSATDRAVVRRWDAQARRAGDAIERLIAEAPERIDWQALALQMLPILVRGTAIILGAL